MLLTEFQVKSIFGIPILCWTDIGYTFSSVIILYNSKLIHTYICVLNFKQVHDNVNISITYYKCFTMLLHVSKYIIEMNVAVPLCVISTKFHLYNSMAQISVAIYCSATISILNHPSFQHTMITLTVHATTHKIMTTVAKGP